MAITPRSFRLNPRLVVVAALAAVGAWTFVQTIGTQQPARTYVENVCAPSTSAMAEWSVQGWGEYVSCLSMLEQGDEAYRAASLAVAHHPTSASLLNLKGFVAARNGDHATAVYDFRTGEQLTGSPDGIFENNIAWTTLFQTSALSPERVERVLLQTRALYQRSLEKGWSCERAHTALYVEYAMADLIARTYGNDDARVADAVSRYSTIYPEYTRCLDRATDGDALVVEELMSAAAMDAEMGMIAGVSHPTRHLASAAAASERGRVLGIEMNREWCASTVPVAAAISTCAAFN